MTVMQKCYKVKSVNNTSAAYWRELTNEKSVRAIAKNIGLDQSKVNRQLNGTSDLRVQTVVAICRHYGIEMAPVFVKAGFLTEDEASTFSAQRQLRYYSDIELSKEMLRRVTEGSATKVITEPVESEVIEQVMREKRADNVTPLPSVGGQVDDLTTAEEEDVKSNYATAANEDDSADRIDPGGP